MKSKLKRVFIISILLFLFPQKVLAVTLTLSNYPSSISSSEFSVDVFVDGPSAGTNYLRVDLYKDGTTKYFGETFNGSSWYSGSDGKQYFPITISSESTASATLKALVGNPNSSEYPGPGSYKLRIRRYTASGNAASSDQQTPIDIQINVATPSPEPTQEPTQEPTTQPTTTPTKTPTPTPKATPKPTSTKKPTIKPTPTSDNSASESSFVLTDISIGDENQTPSPEGQVAGASTSKKFPFQAVGLIMSGVGFMGYGAYSFYMKNKKQKGATMVGRI